MATGVSCAAALLPPIDQMALDWIPAEPEFLLMEGNGGFALSYHKFFSICKNALQRCDRDQVMLISRNPEVCAAELDGEICLFEPVKAEYLNLNATGSAIWNLLEEPATVDLLVTELQNRYAVDAATCRQDTEVFISEALKRGMLQEQQTA